MPSCRAAITHSLSAVSLQPPHVFVTASVRVILMENPSPRAPAPTQASHPRANRRDEASIVNNIIRRQRRWAEVKQDQGPADAACDQPNREKKQVGRHPPENKSHIHHTTSHIVFCASLLSAQRRKKHKHHKHWTGRGVTSTPRSSEHDNPKVVTLPWKRHQSWPASR